jgi:glutaredoxin 3
MKEVLIYTTPTCPYCMRAKGLLSSLDIPFTEIDVAGGSSKRQEIIEKYNWKTVPAIFIGGEFIGGSDDLHRLHGAGKLMELVGI